MLIEMRAFDCIRTPTGCLSTMTPVKEACHVIQASTPIERRVERGLFSE